PVADRLAGLLPRTAGDPRRGCRRVRSAPAAAAAGLGAAGLRRVRGGLRRDAPAAGLGDGDLPLAAHRQLPAGAGDCRTAAAAGPGGPRARGTRHLGVGPAGPTLGLTP